MWILDFVKDCMILAAKFYLGSIFWIVIFYIAFVIIDEIRSLAE